MSVQHPNTNDAVIDAAVSKGKCPHCREPFDTSFPVHMARECDASAYDPSEKPVPETDADPDVPVLEEAPDTIEAGDDLEERARLARQLSKNGDGW